MSDPYAKEARALCDLIGEPALVLTGRLDGGRVKIDLAANSATMDMLGGAIVTLTRAAQGAALHAGGDIQRFLAAVAGEPLESHSRFKVGGD